MINSRFRNIYQKENKNDSIGNYKIINGITNNVDLFNAMLKKSKRNCLRKKNNFFSKRFILLYKINFIFILCIIEKSINLFESRNININTHFGKCFLSSNN